MSLCSILHTNEDDRSLFADFSFVKDLNLNAMFDLRKDAKFGEVELRMEEHFTTNINTIRLRQEMFYELLSNPALYERLKKSFSALYDLFELQKAKSEAESSETLIFSVLELESYVAYMDDIRSIFTEFEVKSELLLRLWDAVRSLCEGGGYEKMKAEVEKQAQSFRNIRSITVGVNLDAQLRPTEAGVISINDRNFFSGDLLDRILRLDLKKDGYSCISPFYPLNKRAGEDETLALRSSVNSSMNKVFHSALRSWSYTVKNHIIRSLRDLAPVVAEWRFVSACTDALLKLKRKGYPLCRAETGDEDRITGLYHPVLAILDSDEKGRRVVKNDLNFSSEIGIYILTGPNQGGKSIYTQAVGILYAMFHLGLPLPAESAVIRPVDDIFTHFVDSGKISYQNGRLSAECCRINKINQSVTENSLFLFDEALSSTNSAEAAAISSEILKAYSEIGARGIWTTHLHELCKLSKEASGGSRIGCLTAAIDERSHERQFRIVPGDGSEQSYASDIAGKYGLSKDDIVKNAKRR